MDVFYEESAVPVGSKKKERFYKVLNVLSYIFIIVAIILFFFGIQFIPVPEAEKYNELWGIAIFFFLNVAFFAGAWGFCFWWKRRINISYDYAFVSGELRISKVFNVNRRKYITSINCGDILQIGDTSNTAFERLKSAPSTKTIRYVANEVEPADGKFYMYVLVGQSGKRLYVLECREELLSNILMFAQRSALESDYVPQAKKQQKKV